MERPRSVVHQILERFGVRLQEKTIFRTICFGLGRDDVREPRHRNLDVFDTEHTSLVPHLIELESRHNEREIDFQTVVVSRFGQSLSLDDAIS